MVLLLSVLFIQAVSSMRLKSLTFDENYYLPAGYSFLKTGDFRMTIDHPPLIPLLSGFPLLFLDLNFPADSELWRNNQDKYSFGKLFLYGSGNDADEMAFRGRIPIVLLSVLLGYYVFLWAKKLYGVRAGFLALFLYVFSPNILAYSRLVTPDFGIACFMFIACYQFWAWLEKPTAKNLVLSGIFLGLALVTKYSALLLFPVFLLLFAYKMFFSSSYEINGLPLLGRPAPFPGMVRILNVTIIISLISLAIIYLAYGLKGDALQLYLQGLKNLQLANFSKSSAAAHFIRPDYHYYLNGEFSVQPWWYYYLAAFLVKTPLPTFILLVLALVLLKKNKPTVYNELWLILPVYLILVTSFLDSVNFGLRRILPLYPFLFVFVSRVAEVKEDAKTFFSKKSVLQPLLGFLGAWYLTASLMSSPDYLTYFNEVAGGPRQGLSYLDDSNIDWGQDLKRLKTYMDEHEIARIKLLYFGTADARYYKIDWEPVPDKELFEQPLPGYYAISAHILIRLKLEILKRGGGRDWLKDFTPVDVIGNSIYIFKF